MAKDIKTKNVFIVGLGNPGQQYLDTPHSSGFMVINEFARRFEFPCFLMEPDGVMVSQKEISGKTVVLAKPQMFMNNSGKAVAKLLAFKKVRRAKSYPALWVINDDLDIPLGKIKIAKNRGSAGHKGVQSIIDRLKTKNFVRLRVGIQTPVIASKSLPSDKYVLKKIAPGEQPVFAAAIDTAVKAIQISLASGIDSAMTEFNK